MLHQTRKSASSDALFFNVYGGLGQNRTADTRIFRYKWTVFFVLRSSPKLDFTNGNVLFRSLRFFPNLRRFFAFDTPTTH